MQFLVSLLILALEPSASIDHAVGESLEIYRCDFSHQTTAGVAREVDADYDGWPDGWTRSRGPSFPAYVEMTLAGPTEAPTSEESWLNVALDGGAAEAFAPALDVSPRFTYIVEGQVRTEGLERDQVYFSVSFYDRDDRLLERCESPRVRSPGAWRTLTIGPLTPRGEAVRKAIIGVHLAPTGEADLHGEARFDNLRLARLPRMALTANSPHHVYDDPRKIVLTCEASGVQERNPEVHLQVLDVFGKLVDETIKQLPGEPIETPTSRAPRPTASFAGKFAWTPKIEQPGYYRVEAELRMRQGLTHQRGFSLVVVGEEPPPGRGASGDGQFGWSLPHDREPLPLEALASLAGHAGIRWVKLPVWFDARDVAQAERLARFVERMDQEGINVVGVLDRPPANFQLGLADKSRVAIAGVFVEKDLWQIAVDPVMTRLTPIIRWWQLGDDYDASFVGFPGLAGKIDEIRQRLSRFGQKILVGFAWRWMDDQPPQTRQQLPWEFLSYTVDEEDPPLTGAEMSRHLERLANSRERRWIGLQPLSKARYDLTTRARDLVDRMLAAKMAGAGVSFVPRPFDPESGLMNSDGTPNELFSVWRTTADLLAGAEYLGSIEMPQGSRNYIFSRGEESVAVVWNDRAVQETLYLGENVQQIDLWSRKTRPTRRDGMHTIDVGPLPSFVTGVHTAVARWRMNFQFDDPRLSSIFGKPQRLEYSYTNPFTQGVSGRVTFHTPEVWDVERKVMPFNVSAGEERHDLLRVTLLPTANSGQQRVQADFEITADRDYRFSVWRTIDVGLGDVSMELNSRLDEEGRLVIEQVFVNQSDESVSFLCQLFAPGRAGQRRPVLNLNRGRTTIVYYVADGRELIGQTLILRAEEIDGERALNYRFEAK